MSTRKSHSSEGKNVPAEEEVRLVEPELLARIDALWKSSRDILPPLDMPRGVRKFRSIEEMSAYREKYENERTARLREERAKKES